MSDKPTVYLAGPIQHTQDDGKSWRKYIKDKYEHLFEFQDPWDKYPDGVSNDEILDPESEHHWTDEEIMASDREQIDQSDGLIIHYEQKPIWGTPREMEYVSEWGRGPDIPVVIQTKEDETSPWMHDAVAIVERFDAAVKLLKEAIDDDGAV